MSFGFGISDIITISRTTLRICLTVRSAPEEQQALALELEFLGQLVGVIGNRIACSELPRSITQSTRQQLLQCQRLLRELDEITTKYMKTCPETKWGNQVRRVKWGLYKKGQVMQLLSDLRCLSSFLDFLLLTYSMKTIQENSVILKKIENRLPASLDEWSGCRPIRFIDALDRRRVCSFELCNTWEAFQDFVKFNFKHSVGKGWVAAGRYEITNESGGGEILKACVWNSTVEPGITVSMAMVLRKLKGSGAAEHDCPSCDSPYEGVERKELERAQCKKCATWFQISPRSQIEGLCVKPNSYEAKPLAQPETAEPLCDIDEVRYFRRLHIFQCNWNPKGRTAPPLTGAKIVKTQDYGARDPVMR